MSSELSAMELAGSPSCAAISCILESAPSLGLYIVDNVLHPDVITDACLNVLCFRICRPLQGVSYLDLINFKCGKARQVGQDSVVRS